MWNSQRRLYRKFHVPVAKSWPWSKEGTQGNLKFPIRGNAWCHDSIAARYTHEIMQLFLKGDEFISGIFYWVYISSFHITMACVIPRFPGNSSNVIMISFLLIWFPCTLNHKCKKIILRNLYFVWNPSFFYNFTTIDGILVKN